MPTRSPRIIQLAGVKNFRDIGGYKTTDGGVIRWGKLFRSGHLSDMTDACGMEMLARDIETVVDFRSEPEKQRHPVHWTSMWAPTYVPQPIGGNAAAWVHALFERIGQDEDGGVEGVYGQFIRAFRDIPTKNVEGLAGFFQTILGAKDNSAVLYHCTAGKDRTGIASALLLKILGVDEATIMEDFLTTNRAVDLEAGKQQMVEFLSVKAGKPVSPEAVMPMVGVDAPFLEATWAVIDEDYGSFDAYVRDGLGLTDDAVATLRGRYVARGDG